MANETKIINKPKVTVDGDVSIDDSTPISTSGTITGTVSTNATIQGTPNVAVTGNVAIDDSTPIDTAVTGTVTTNATIQNATLATKGKTSYSDSTSNVQYWLGLEADGQLTKTHIGTATSTKQIYNYALPTTVVGGDCLERVYSIDTSVIT
jgi:hypothetical protein